MDDNTSDIVGIIFVTEAKRVKLQGNIEGNVAGSRATFFFYS